MGKAKAVVATGKVMGSSPDLTEKAQAIKLEAEQHRPGPGFIAR